MMERNYPKAIYKLSLYISKTIQEFRGRIPKHINSIYRGEETSIARDIREYHQNNINVLKCWGVKQIKLGMRKGRLDKRLLQEDAKWMFMLIP